MLLLTLIAFAPLCYTWFSTNPSTATLLSGLFALGVLLLAVPLVYKWLWEPSAESFGGALEAAESDREALAAYRRAVDEHAIVATTNRRREITDCNDRFVEISGYSRAELIGNTHRIVNSGHHSREFWKEMWRTVGRGGTWTGVVCNRAKNGSLYWVETSITPLIGSAGRIEGYVAVRNDITAHRLAESVARALSSRLELATRGAGIGVWELSVATGALEWDAQTHRIHGMESGGQVKSVRHWMRLVDPDFRDEARKHVDDVLSGAEKLDHTFVVSTPGGETRYVQSVATPIVDDDGRVSRLTGVSWDITERVQYEQALVEAQLGAEAASLAKSEFLANMSHEIRTPLTAILGYTDLLAHESGHLSDPAAVADALTTVESNAKHLLTIINDILDMSKIEAGRMTIERMAFDPAEVIEEVAGLLHVRAVGKNIELGVDYASDLPETIESDPTRLRQILLNLVGNAVKFTEYGAVSIRVGASMAAPSFWVEVVDTGIGMTAEQLSSISKFDAFAQADGSMARRFGGTGLGLRISNSLAQLLGGRIEVDSREGRGSTFTMTLDLGPMDAVPWRSREALREMRSASPAAPTEPTSLPSAPLPLTGLRILVAEDGPDNQRLIRFHLERAGAEVTVGENGQVAVDEMRAAANTDSPFHLVLMDMQMPELDGYAATSLLRTEGYELPIVALTAHAMSGDRERCLTAGCTEFLTKPIDKKLLIHRITDLAG